MKAGRVIGGDEHEARVEAKQILERARTEAEQLLADARAEIERANAQLVHAQVPPEGIAEAIAAANAQATEVGVVDEVIGLIVRARVPGVALGELVKIDRRDKPPLAAEVVGFRGEQAVLLPLGELAGVAPASRVWRTGEPLTIRAGDDLLGRVLDGVGAPIDGGPPLAGERWEVDRPAPSPL